MKKCWLVLILFSFLFNFSFGQNQQIEKLKEEIRTAEEDTSKVNAILALSKCYFGTAPEKSISYGEIALSLAQKIPYRKGIALAYKNIGIGYYNKGSYIEALQNYKLSLDIFSSMKDSLGIANIFSNIGNIYYIQGEDFKALDYYIKSLKIAEKLKDKVRIATANGNIGAVYLNKRATYYKALEYNLSALKIGEEIGDKNIIGTSSVNIGQIYFDQGNTSSAIRYFQKSLAAFEGTENYSISLIFIGKVYSKNRDYVRASSYFDQAYQYAKKIDAKLDIVNALNELGMLYEKTEDYKQALSKYEEAEAIATKLGATEKLGEIYGGQANVRSQLRDFSGAYKYQKLLTTIKDTLYNKDADKKMGNLQFNFDLEKKQNEINLLQKEKEISAKEIKSKQIIQAALSGFLIVLFVLLAFVYRIYIIKKKTNIELEEKNDKIELQKSEITKSIEYAKKIQDAMLPEEDLISEVLYNSFLMYRPKDIVSGDFYLCINENKKIFLAVADCTGHGVPGALMSMIGGNILNKLISDKGLNEPTEILDQLNFELIHALKQNKKEGNDGMDIAMCVIDFGAGILKFAGAFRPLWMIRDHELTEIKGSKFPIGGHQIHDERHFKTHQMAIQKGDRFFIFTDGFADQFGGVNGKKLTTKKLKEYLLLTNKDAIKSQGHKLSSFFDTWKGENEQLDDVCFIGFEVS